MALSSFFLARALCSVIPSVGRCTNSQKVSLPQMTDKNMSCTSRDVQSRVLVIQGGKPEAGIILLDHQAVEDFIDWYIIYLIPWSDASHLNRQRSLDCSLGFRTGPARSCSGLPPYRRCTTSQDVSLLQMLDENCTRRGAKKVNLSGAVNIQSDDTTGLVVVAMSGGVDSSVTAKLMVDQVCCSG